jgi:hypothetical protein
MQVPAPSECERETSVERALELLQQLGPEARLPAGATEKDHRTIGEGGS